MRTKHRQSARPARRPPKPSSADAPSNQTVEEPLAHAAHALDVLVRKIGIAYLKAAASDPKDRARFLAGLVRYVSACQLRERKSLSELLLGDGWQPEDVPFVLPPRDRRKWKTPDRDMASHLEVRARYYGEELPRAEKELRDLRATRRISRLRGGESASDIALRRTAHAVGRSEGQTRSLLRRRLTPDARAALEATRGALPSPEARRWLAVERWAECILDLTNAPRTRKTRREALQRAASGSYPPADEAPPPP